MSATRFDIEAPLTLPAQIEARASHPQLAKRVFLQDETRTWTYREYRDQSVRYAHLILGRSRGAGSEGPPRVAMMMENHLELLALYGGCGYAGATLFGLNTGLRGEVLAGVLNQSCAQLLIIDSSFVERIEGVLGDLEYLAERDILVLAERDGQGEGEGDGEARGERASDVDPARDLLRCLEREVSDDLGPPDVEVTPETVQMVIYTSGTTGLPKGINNNHLKLLLIGKIVAERIGLSADDCGYGCMPLFHSNAIFLGFHPAFHSGARMVVRRRFSARAFAPDIKRFGVTYWNYVGEPVHYILEAVAREYGGDEERIRQELTQHADNHLAFTLGNGAAPPDIDRFMDWFGLDDMFELYGSTEAAISTFRTKHDPRGCVGEITDAAVKIIDSSGSERPGAVLDDSGRILNYDDAVGEICRVAPDTGLFQGYFDNQDANSNKYRDGVYHSGDLGHILERDGRRFLFFDGRTEDWIRKDGENFSAAQVARILHEHPDVALAAAYGVPCAVSDELVMGAIKLHPNARFDPQEFFDFCSDQIANGGMDPKWFPDYLRIVDEFPYTETQKILVRELRRDHFHRDKLPQESIYWRTRGSESYREFGPEDFATTLEAFRKREREHLL